jgi:hypothetical protein
MEFVTFQIACPRSRRVEYEECLLKDPSIGGNADRSQFARARNSQAGLHGETSTIYGWRSVQYHQSVFGSQLCTGRHWPRRHAQAPSQIPHSFMFHIFYTHTLLCPPGSLHRQFALPHGKKTSRHPRKSRVSPSGKQTDQQAHLSIMALHGELQAPNVQKGDAQPWR